MVLIVGSGVQYGRHDESEMPRDESAEQRPVSTYGASKAAQETIALQIFRATGVRVVCVRSFNHSGIGHGAQYLLPSLVARVRDIAAGAPPRLALGNDVTRDYVHVDDVVDAYLSLAERGRPGEVLQRGERTRRDGAATRHRRLAPSGRARDISTDAALVRATDIPTLIGSPAKLARETGWAPRKTHLDIIDDLLRSPRSAEAHAAQS
jgi:GDP-4-dehydro-6-deoxy-D-mannose reductase